MKTAALHYTTPLSRIVKVPLRFSHKCLETGKEPLNLARMTADEFYFLITRRDRILYFPSIS